MHFDEELSECTVLVEKVFNYRLSHFMTLRFSHFWYARLMGACGEVDGLSLTSVIVRALGGD